MKKVLLADTLPAKCADMLKEAGFEVHCRPGLSEEELKQPEPCFPLEVGFCPNCALVQIMETVSPEVLFCDEYPYYSSFSPALLAHSRENVLDIVNRRELSSDSFVV